MRVGQGLEENAVDDREHGDRATDAQCEREGGREREPRRAAERPQTIAKIARGILDESSTELIARAFLGGFDAPELQKRLAPCFIRRQTRSDVLRRLLLDVEAELGVESALERAALEER